MADTVILITIPGNKPTNFCTVTCENQLGTTQRNIDGNGAVVDG